MKAAVLHGINDLRVEDVPPPTTGPGEVLVRVRDCGVCSSDVPRITQTGTYHFPCIPGHELAGTAVAVGDGVELQLERLYAIFPLIPCRKCPFCQIGRFAQCTDYRYLGSRCDGGFAEYVAVPAANCIPVPDGVPSEWAALTEPTAVALHALRQGTLEPGASVVILGLGTIGQLAAQWARILGAGQVIGVDIVPEKLELARALGFERTIQASPERSTADAVKALTNGLGADLVIEAAGHPATYNDALDCARPLGQVVWMGNLSGDLTLPKARVSSILRKQLTIHGTWNSDISLLPCHEWAAALEFMAEGRLNLGPLITHRFPLARIQEALAMMTTRQEVFEKVLIQCEER